MTKLTNQYDLWKLKNDQNPEPLKPGSYGVLILCLIIPLAAFFYLLCVIKATQNYVIKLPKYLRIKEELIQEHKVIFQELQVFKDSVNK
ncbi:hypothetical protein [[Mycoplasma] testudinis]|uniref:hypothetical protein n=1 Tax=[Mycoplasma] testudinis TaxID=33924 RepID=UPI0004876EEE|nr:hypothetical protein [[Mycoplasma] testudinis]